MKKIVSLLVLVAVFGFVGSVSADTVKCGDVDPVTNLVVSCGNGSPENVVNVWGTSNSQIAHIQPGVTVTDEGGVPSTCPSWFTNYCVDISHTTYYRNAMLTLGSQLKALGYRGGVFGYWINLAQ